MEIVEKYEDPDPHTNKHRFVQKQKQIHKDTVECRKKILQQRKKIYNEERFDKKVIFNNNQ